MLQRSSECPDSLLFASLTMGQAAWTYCVCHHFLSGKWIYEVLISSQGLMQIGWCTLNCRFNQEVQ